MKLQELYNLLNDSLEVIETSLENGESIYIFNISVKYETGNTALINVDASSKHHDLVWRFIYSTLLDLEDIEWVDYHRYISDKDLYLFGVEFK